MKKLSAALLLYLGLASAALAQTKFTMPPPAGVSVMGLQVVTTCGAASGLVAGNTAFAAMDTTGTLCTAAGGGGGGGLAITDQAAWTQAASTFTPSGGVFNDTATLSSGQQGTSRLTTKRAQIVDVDSTGNQLHTDLTSPIPDCGATPCTNKIGVVGVNTWAAGVLGAMANYGTSPGAVLVPGVNAFITNTVPVTLTSTTITGTVAATQSGAWSLSANQSVNVAQVNGITTLTGTGATGTGAQRVTISTDQATNAGAALVKGGVGTVNGGSDYETVAASQTAQALGATGATGDYLSHCILQPTTTAAGTMTILDNATVIYTFTTGTLSNLASIAIPIGAISVSGAWKVTTGANETATCFGKFT